MKQLLLLGVLSFFTFSTYAQGWGQTQKIVAVDRHVGQEYGWSVAIQGDIAAIGAKSDNEGASDGGAVYMYEKDASDNWVFTQKLINTDVGQFDRFGQSVAIDGNYMIVGARGQDYDENGNNFENGEGAAYIFEKDGIGNWNQIQKLVASDRGATFQAVFGETVAISGNYAVVNKPTASGELGITAGVCYIFERDTNGVWNEVQKIINSHRNNDDRFGDFSISISGNLIAIGARRQDYDASGQNEIINAGAVYIFERDTNGVWNETQKIVASSRLEGYTFGNAVEIDGNFMVVGSSGNVNSDAGTAYVFKKIAGTWQEIQQLVPSNIGSSYNFGKTVAIEGDRLVVGAFTEVLSSFSSAGAAYVFEKDTNDSWNQVARIGALDADVQDNFSFGIGISGDFIIGGAYREDEDENGENSISQAGSTYVFNVNEPNTIPNTLSVVEHNFSSVIKAYPNPIENILHLDFENYVDEIKVTIHNVLGQHVFSENYNNRNSIQLELNNQSKGIYIVEVKVGEQLTSVLKVVKH